MNIKKLLEMQRNLDIEILERAGIKEYPFKNIKLALLVELGELANEWKGFKHWKKNKVINKEKLIEEWADCFHFALSLENELHQVAPAVIKNIDVIIEELDKGNWNMDVIEAFELNFQGILNIHYNSAVLLNIIALGRCLNISLDEMEQAYFNKNKVNHDRQAAGY